MLRYSVYAFIALLAATAYAQSTTIGTSGATTATEIQAALNANNYVKLEPRTYSINKPIVIGPNQKLEGSGKGTVLQPFGTPGPYLIQFGPATGSMYGGYIEDLCLFKGGIEFRQFAQHCGVDKIWVSNAPEHAFYFGPDSFGEGLTLRDCIAWEAGKDGFHVNTKAAFVNLTFDHCNAQNCKRFGVFLTAMAPSGDVFNTLFRDCIIQGNGQLVSGVASGADIYISGYVLSTVFERTHVETTKGLYGLYVEPNKQNNSAVGLVEIRDRCTFAAFGASVPIHVSNMRTALWIDRTEFSVVNKPVTYTGIKPIVTSSNLPINGVVLRQAQSPLTTSP